MTKRGSHPFQSVRTSTFFLVSSIAFVLLLSLCLHVFRAEGKPRDDVAVNRNQHNNVKFLEDLKPKESLLIVKTNTDPSFLQVLPDPSLDRTNTEHMLKYATMHPKFTVMLRDLLRKACSNNELFIDCGSNLGYFSLLAASMGCRVTAIEANPHLVDIFRKSIQLNSLDHKIKSLHAAVSDLPSKSQVQFLLYPGHWGLSHLENIGEKVQGSRIIHVDTVQIQDAVQEDATILKIDVEGAELEAIRSARELLINHRIQHIFIEWDKIRNQTEAISMLRWLEKDLGYEVLALPYESYDDDIDWTTNAWLRDARLISPKNYEQITEVDLWIRKRSVEMAHG